MAEKDDQWKQDAAVGMLKEVGKTAVDAASTMAVAVQDYIQRGPSGVRQLCFLGGILTVLFGLLSLVDVLEALAEPLQYLVNSYLMLFGLVTCIIESPPEWLQQSEKLQRAQSFVHEFAKFLTTLGGRGLFYLFQGSLSMTFSWSLSFLLALYMFFMGVVCILMQYGIDVPGVKRVEDSTEKKNGDYIYVAN
eukprot:gnl/TRDRNA2_/TRDRNA2_40885_c0_seq1.p1 gnl/TRDRNA2_/TRDRNA2_40885_c0~~gnl/TRDRNA2_/TRDRNA2_40885_c0_seq1.p1  ORF type:complete len:192 (-),score=49.14 gnl/TRDRNA2_/TRDRNA2_40885_c0_seq1:171-746(-)